MTVSPTRLRSFEPATLLAVSSALRQRANALIPLYDVLARDGDIPETQWSGRSGDAYRKQHRMLLSSIDELIDAYVSAASAIDDLAASPAPGAWDRVAPRIGRALERINERTASLERFAPRSLGVFSPEVRTANAVPLIPEGTDDASRVAALVARIPSRPGTKGTPRGMTRAQFRRLVASSMSAAPTLAAAQVLLWVSKNLGAPYDALRRQDPGRYDCSSFVASALQFASVSVSKNGVLPDTSSMLNAGTAPGGYLRELAIGDARPGDLLFWGPPEYETGHVAVVLENGFIAHAPRTGEVTSIARLPDSPRPIAARRIVQP